ncbi:MAG TPA: alpha/beta hydrolase [Candidatus Acidoferrum sp.]|nr:alpha/beta hydrolase [Candidatus Acidoferrum sp.]
MASPSIPGTQATPKKSRWWRIVKRVLIGLVLLIACTALAGAAYQAIANWRDARRFPQEGRSIALGAEFPGVSLNLNCVGQGAPTVILDSGLGVPAAGWDLVMPDVAKFARVCSYDRAGYGWSSAGPMPRTSDEIVRELHALLAASGEKGPYVLVAHSFGGYNVRVYADKYPGDVAGLVLVDTSHEDQEQMMPASLRQLTQEQVKQLDSQKRLMPILIVFGIARLTTGDDGESKLSKDFRDKMKYLQLQMKFIEAAFSEIKSFSLSAEEVRRTGNLGDRPLVVLTAGKDLEAKDLPKDVSVEEMREFRKTWVGDLQVRQTKLSTRGKQIVVPDSTHMIPMERPDAVVNAIREVCDAVKTEPSPKN